MSEDKSKRWLIKKNAEIIGPLSNEEVEEGLKTGNFSVLDSACLPGEQVWLCLGNYENFSEFMDKVKGSSSATAQTLLSRITDTIFVNTNTNTLTDTSELDTVASTTVAEDVPYEVIGEKQMKNKFMKIIFQKKIIFLFAIVTTLLIIYFIASDLFRNNNIN